MRDPENGWPDVSFENQYESSYSHDLHNKRHTLDSNMKIFHPLIPNAISATNVIVVLPAENHQAILVVDGPHLHPIGQLI